MDQKAKGPIAQFYTTRRWRVCRQSYAKSKGWLCERCLSRGLIVPGTEVHHKIRLTPQTVNDPNVSLNWRNLELLCAECHEKEHGKLKERADPVTGHVEL